MTLAFMLVGLACAGENESTDVSVVVASHETVPGTSNAPAIDSVPRALGESGPAPTEMCGGVDVPAIAAYDLASGTFKWSACSPDGDAQRFVLEATDDAVYLEVIFPNTGEQELVGYEASTGTQILDGSLSESQPSLPDRTVASPSVVVVDGVRLEGGQDNPTTALDDATGDVLWSKPGSPVYDDVWAVGDGAVYVTDHQGPSGVGGLVAYELRSGDVRWKIEPAPSDIRPWHVDENRLFAIWTNLAVISTDDGSTIWRTQFPDVLFPRMTGVRANSDTVFVAFSSIPSGGD